MKSLHLNIRGRLILGFSILCFLMAGVVGTTITKVRTVSESTDRTVNLRVPTAMTASDLVAGIYASLASLRGWLITGNEAFKAERAGLWKDIQTRGSEMDRLSSQWTVEQNKVDWKQAKPLLDELRNAQDKAEAIAHTIDEQPAAKMLATEAAPLAKLMLQKATSIIDEEGGIASTDARKSLLIDFADMRGSMAMAIGAIRAYLLTADVAFKNRVRGALGAQSEEIRRAVEAPLGDDEPISRKPSIRWLKPAPNSRRCRRRCSISAPRTAGTWRNGS